MLDDERFTASGKRLHQIERPGKGLLVGAQAKENQRRFRSIVRA
jgi:hypothetical protein